jgi:hypothetical protein
MLLDFVDHVKEVNDEVDNNNMELATACWLLVFFTT